MKLLFDTLACLTLWSLAEAIAKLNLLIWSKAWGRRGLTAFSSINWRWFSLEWRNPPWMNPSTDLLSLACLMSQMSLSTILTSSAFSMSSLAQSRTMFPTTKMLLAGISVKRTSSFSMSLTSSSLATSIQLGLTSLHLCLCRKLTASQRGTDTGNPGLNGPTSPAQINQNKNQAINQNKI